MFSLFFSFSVLILSSSNSAMFSHVVSSPSCSRFSYLSNQDEYNEYINTKCKDMNNEACLQNYKRLSSFICTEKDDINDKLKKVSKDTEFLFITLLNPNVAKSEIDLSKLPKKMNVQITDSEKYFGADLSNKFVNLKDKNEKDDDSEKQDKENSVVKLNGDIYSKVSFLTLAIDEELEITKTTLKCHTLFLYHVDFSKNSRGIESNILICTIGDENSYSEIEDKIRTNNKFVNSLQISINPVGALSSSNYQTRITLSNNQWQVDFVATKSSTKVLADSSASINYDLASQLSIIGLNTEYDLRLSNSFDTKTKVKPINISVQSLGLNKYNALSTNEAIQSSNSKSITISTSSDSNSKLWEEIDLTVYVEAGSDYTVQQTQTKATISQGNIYSYENPSSHLKNSNVNLDSEDGKWRRGDGYDDDDDDDDDDGNLGTGAIIGIVIAGVVVLALIVVIIVVVVLRFKKSKVSNEEDPSNDPKPNSNNLDNNNSYPVEKINNNMNNVNNGNTNNINDRNINNNINNDNINNINDTDINREQLRSDQYGVPIYPHCPEFQQNNLPIDQNPQNLTPFTNNAQNLTASDQIVPEALQPYAQTQDGPIQDKGIYEDQMIGRMSDTNIYQNLQEQYNQSQGFIPQQTYTQDQMPEQSPDLLYPPPPHFPHHQFVPDPIPHGNV